GRAEIHAVPEIGAGEIVRPAIELEVPALDRDESGLFRNLVRPLGPIRGTGIGTERQRQTSQRQTCETVEVFHGARTLRQLAPLEKRGCSSPKSGVGSAQQRKAGGFQMKRPNRLLHTTLIFCTAACVFPLIVTASIPPDRDQEVEEVVVTGAMRVGQ